MSQRLDHEGP